MSKIKIETGIPVVNARASVSLYGPRTELTIALHNLQKSESIFVKKGNHLTIKSELQSARRTKEKAKSKTRFVTRLVDGGIRIWRTK
jgi:uncharacterized protein (AIM24 family)